MATRVPETTEGGRVPPQSVEAERAVLGAMLLDREAIARAVETLDESCFYREAHKRIFRCILELFERNETADMVTLTEALRRSGGLEAVGGPQYLTQLFEYVATSASLEYHAKIVLQKATLRKLIQTGTDIVSQGFEGRGDPAEILDRAEQAIFAISHARLRQGFMPLESLVFREIEIIEELREKKRHVTGVPSGFIDLDRMTAGFQKSDLIIVAGRPSMGKTSFCLNIAEHAALKENVACGIFSLEMAKETLVQRLLCSQAQVEGQKVRRGFISQKEMHRISDAADRIYKAPIYIDDTPAIGVLEMRAKARRLMAEVELGLIVIDYVQLIRGAAGAESRQQEISQISRSLKALAKELQVPVIALSQLSRDVEKRGGDKRPVLSDLRESGALEQDADVVIFIYRPEMYDKKTDPGVAEILVRKQRNGPTGEVKLTFIAEYARFENYSRISEADLGGAETFEPPEI
jgi:replicative DNA helicase